MISNAAGVLVREPFQAGGAQTDACPAVLAQELPGHQPLLPPSLDRLLGHVEAFGCILNRVDGLADLLGAHLQAGRDMLHQPAQVFPERLARQILPEVAPRPVTRDLVADELVGVGLVRLD